MSNIRKVKIENILQSQIPAFLSSESPLFQEFLKQYYISQTTPTGVVNIANSLDELKNIDTYISELSYFSDPLNSCYLINDINSFEFNIEVNSTEGFPDNYGLLRIDDEIIFYAEKDSTTFLDCHRGFSGITNISDTQNSDGLEFTVSSSSDHTSKAIVQNLNYVFYEKLFEKFKAHYLPDFEKRKLNTSLNLDLFLSRARDFYLTKGSDISFEILFEILYDDPVSIFKPKDNIIKTTSGKNFNTKNVLVETIDGDFDIPDLIGLSLTQNISDDIKASASIYNVGFRPTDDMGLYEISLDVDSFIYDFTSTKKTIILEKLSDSIFVDSTVGFPESGTLYVKIKNPDQTFSIETLNYDGKTINKFLNISGISLESYSTIKSKDELIEDNFAEVMLDNGDTVKFRLLNLIESFDYSTTNLARVNDVFFINSFGDNFSDLPEYVSWIYNYPTYHNIKSSNSSGYITFYESINFRVNERIELIDVLGNSFLTKVKNVISLNEIEINASDLNSGNKKIKVKRIIEKSPLNSSEDTYIENAYFNENNNTLVIASSGLPYYEGNTQFNNYNFNLIGIGTVFTSRNLENSQNINHYLLSGERIYLNSQRSDLTSGMYFIKKVTEQSLSLYKSSGDLYVSFASNSLISQKSNPVIIENGTPTTLIGSVILSDYQHSLYNFKNQLLLKEFKVQQTLNENKITLAPQIYTIEDAYNAFKS